MDHPGSGRLSDGEHVAAGGGGSGPPLRTLGLGDRVEHVDPGARRKVLIELGGLWLVTLLLIRGVVTVQKLGLPDWTLAAVPFLFIYAPVALCRWRGVDSYAYRVAIPALSDRAAWKEAALVAGKAIAIIVVPWLVGYHLYQTQIFHMHPHLRVPKDALLLVPQHLFVVAIPEEFFYRGYFQTRLNEVFPRKFLVFGTPMGWGAVIACLFFAFGHSLVMFRWWHFATFFPGLLFAWMRERTGGTVAGAFMHAWCNVTVVVLDTIYGVI